MSYLFVQALWIVSFDEDIIFNRSRVVTVNVAAL